MSAALDREIDALKAEADEAARRAMAEVVTHDARAASGIAVLGALISLLAMVITITVAIFG